MTLFVPGVIGLDEKRNGLLVDLDSLFDTRLACVTQFDANIAINALANGWSTRIYDKCPGLPDEVYKDLYKARDISIFEYAQPTSSIDFIRSWGDFIHRSRDNSPFPGYAEVFINFWPYKFPKAKAVEIAKTLNESFGSRVKVTIVNIDPLTITCSDMKMLLSGVVMYDWPVWWQHVCSNADLITNKIPDVTFYVPKLFQGHLTDEVYTSLKDTDVFRAAVETMMPLIGLDFMDVDMFSVSVDSEEIRKAYKEAA